MLILEKLHLKRIGTLIVPSRRYEIIGIEGDGIAILRRDDGFTKIVWGHNIVTNEGDKYYAQKACGESPTNNFNSCYLATAGPATPAKTDDYDDFTVVSGSEKAVSSGYPKTNDDDSDNTGAGVDIVTWKFFYAASDGPFTSITHSFISVASAGSGSPILNSYKWSSSWDKDSSTTCTIFFNHEMSGQ